MTGPLDAYDAPELPDAAPAAPPPPAFGDVLAAGRTMARSDRTDAVQIRLSNGYEPILEALNDGKSRDAQLANPGWWQGDMDARPSGRSGTIASVGDLLSVDTWTGMFGGRVDRAQQQDLIFARIRDERRRRPDFLKGIPDTAAAYRDQLLEREKAERARAGATIGRSEGVGGTIASFAGQGFETMLDPVNLASIPLGGGGKTIAQVAAREALVGAGVTALTIPSIAENRHALDEEFGVLDAAETVALAAGASAVLGGGIVAGTRGAARVADRLTPLSTKVARELAAAELPDGALPAIAREAIGIDRMTPTERAAVHVLERQAEVDAASPFVAGAAGADTHGQRLAASMSAILDDVPPAAAFTPMSPPRLSAIDAVNSPAGAIQFVVDQLEGGSARTVDTGGVTRFGISQDANPDVNVETLGRDGAEQLYRGRYWAPMQLDGQDPRLALVGFDAAVNHGVGRARQMMAAAGGSPERLIELRRAEYARLIEVAPQRYAKYARGWENRLRKLEARIGAVPGEARPVLAREGFGDALDYQAAQAALDAEAAASHARAVEAEPIAADPLPAESAAPIRADDPLPEIAAAPSSPARTVPPEVLQAVPQVRSIVETPGLSLKPDQVAKRLGIDIATAQQALAELVRSGRLRMTQGSWKGKGANRVYTEPKFVRPLADRSGRDEDLLTFIADRGGLSPTGVAAGSSSAGHKLGDFQKYVPGAGMLVRKNGASLHEMMETLHEAGWFPGKAWGAVTEDDVIGLLDRATRSGPVKHPNAVPRERARAEIDAELADRIDSNFADRGIDYDDGLLADAARRAEQTGDIDQAVDDALAFEMEQAARSALFETDDHAYASIDELLEQGYGGSPGSARDGAEGGFGYQADAGDARAGAKVGREPQDERGLQGAAADDREAAGLAGPVDAEASRAFDQPDGDGAKAQAESLTHDLRGEAEERRYDYASHFEGVEADANRAAVDALNGEITQQDALATISALVRDGTLSEGIARINLDRLDQLRELEIRAAFEAPPPPKLDAGPKVDPARADRQRQQAELGAAAPLRKPVDQDGTMGLALFDQADQPGFRLDEEGDETGVADLLKALDEDDAANAVLRGCLK